MANTRRYRDALGYETAASILQEHAGSQWDPRAVEHVLDVVRESSDFMTFDTLDREHADHADACMDALPDEVVELLVALRD